MHTAVQVDVREKQFAINQRGHLHTIVMDIWILSGNDQLFDAALRMIVLLSYRLVSLSIVFAIVFVTL